MALLSSIVARGIGRGEFRAVDPQHAARLAIAPLLLIVSWRASFAGQDAVPYDMEGLVESHIDVLLRGLAP